MSDRPLDQIVHYSDWAQQPDVHLACGVWTTPTWSPRRVCLPNGIYEGDDDVLYAFEGSHRLVSCPECLGWLERKDP